MHPETALNLELAVTRRLTSKLRSAAHREAWRRTKQARASRIGKLVLAARHVLGAFTVAEERTVRVWRFVDADSGSALIELVTETPGRTIADLLIPILVLVHRDELELTRFDAHARAGAAVVRRAKRAP